MKPKEKHEFLRLYNVHKNYRVISEVGSGTYGRVYKALCHKTNKYVALKKIDMSRQEMDGFPITAIREIKLLRMLSHKNIIALLEIIMSRPSIPNKFRGSTYLVFEYMDHDFVGLMTIKFRFKLSEIKCIFRQLLEGLHYLHEKKIIHRDMKSANILLNNHGEVKIADFGLARQFINPQQAYYTNKVVTLWYRAPELLLGSTNYSSQIDLWSVGCIFVELLTGEILFKGDKETRQLELIFEICGSPTKENWPDADKLELFASLAPKTPCERRLRELVKSKKPDIDEVTLDLLDKLLALDPKKRLSAEQALNHEFFKREPLECALKEMPKIEKECHETLLRSKKVRREDVIKLENREKSPQNDENSKKTPGIVNNNSNNGKFFKDFSRDKGNRFAKTREEGGQMNYFARGFKNNNANNQPNNRGFYKKPFSLGKEAGFLHYNNAKANNFYKNQTYNPYRKQNYKTFGMNPNNPVNNELQISVVERKNSEDEGNKVKEEAKIEQRNEINETIEALRSHLPAGGLKYLIQNSNVSINLKDEVRESLRGHENTGSIVKDEESVAVQAVNIEKILQEPVFENAGKEIIKTQNTGVLLDKNILNEKRIKRKNNNREDEGELDKKIKKIHIE